MRNITIRRIYSLSYHVKTNAKKTCVVDRLSAHTYSGPRCDGGSAMYVIMISETASKGYNGNFTITNCRAQPQWTVISGNTCTTAPSAGIASNDECLRSMKRNICAAAADIWENARDCSRYRWSAQPLTRLNDRKHSWSSPPANGRPTTNSCHKLLIARGWCLADGPLCTIMVMPPSSALLNIAPAFDFASIGKRGTTP